MRGTQVPRETMAMNKYLSKITVSVNGLNAPTKRQRVAEWIRKHSRIYAVYKRPPSEQKLFTG